MAQSQDRWLLLGLALLGFCTTRLVHKQLLEVVKASQITQEDVPPMTVNQQTEDALKLDTLEILSGNANYEIRKAAITIILERAIKTGTLDLFWKDIGGGNEGRRNKALTTAKYLTEALPKCLETNQATIWYAIIECLCNLYPQSARYERAAFLGQTIYRSQPERDALNIVLALLKQSGIRQALDCGLVNRWLARYPFGGNVPSRYLGCMGSHLSIKQKMVYKLLSHESDDLVMADIIERIFSIEEGCEQMTQVGLVDKKLVVRTFLDSDTDSTQDSDSETDNHQGDSDTNVHRTTADRLNQLWHQVNRPMDDIRIGPMMRRGQRVREESLEEQILRRRRREAIVIGEPGRPLAHDNIVESIY